MRCIRPLALSYSNVRVPQPTALEEKYIMQIDSRIPALAGTDAGGALASMV
jgi:hypothetical protein